MDRLTKIQDYGVLTIKQGGHADVTIWMRWDESRDDRIEDALLKLAEYEDTGLEPSEIIKGKCKWTQYDKESTGMYETGCEHLFEINNGTPSENNMRYCCYCGKRIVEVRDER